MSIVGLDAPDFRTISDFRKRHLKALSELFLQVVHLCAKAGLAKLGHVGLDGTKIKANASKHKAMSYGRMEDRAAELEGEVARWLNTAEAADAEEDKLYGRDKTGDEMPDWVADKQRRAERIRQAKAELEAEAKPAAAAKLKERAAPSAPQPASTPTRVEAMRAKIKAGGHASPYRLRKQLPEPVFGQIKQARGFRQFLLRGIEKVRAEWALICTAHNLLKLAQSRTPSAPLQLATGVG